MIGLGASADLGELARGCCAIARSAGRAILDIYASDFRVEHKQDESPLTAADLAAHRAIVSGLPLFGSHIPVLSEESVEQATWQERKTWTRYWLVDPLDGTREFVKRNGEFTVNIALIDHHRPILGVVYAPVLDEMYSAWSGGNAFFDDGKSAPDALHTRARGNPLIVAGSRSHADPRLLDALGRLGAHELQALGSSLKFCRTARANADIYIRFGPTSEWDTAAGQCVLEQAGGSVTDMQGETLRYNTKDSLLNPDFLAFGDRNVDYARLLSAAQEK